VKLSVGFVVGELVGGDLTCANLHICEHVFLTAPLRGSLPMESTGVAVPHVQSDMHLVSGTVR
jgi:hypothetical protein